MPWSCRFTTSTTNTSSTNFLHIRKHFPGSIASLPRANTAFLHEFLTLFCCKIWPLGDGVLWGKFTFGNWVFVRSEDYSEKEGCAGCWLGCQVTETVEGQWRAVLLGLSGRAAGWRRPGPRNKTLPAAWPSNQSTVLAIFAWKYLASFLEDHIGCLGPEAGATPSLNKQHFSWLKKS